MPPSVGITHDENTVTGGDNLDISPNGEKDIYTPKKGLVPDVNEDNHDGINKGKKRVNNSSSETESVPSVIPKDCFEVPLSVGITHDENKSLAVTIWIFLPMEKKTYIYLKRVQYLMSMKSIMME